MNRDFSLIIQFDLYLSRSASYVFSKYEIDTILSNLTKSDYEKRFCLNFFKRNSILTLCDPISQTYYYNLEKLIKYKPYPNYQKITSLIKKESVIELDFTNLTIS